MWKFTMIRRDMVSFRICGAMWMLDFKNPRKKPACRSPFLDMLYILQFIFGGIGF